MLESLKSVHYHYDRYFSHQQQLQLQANNNQQAANLNVQTSGLESSSTSTSSNQARHSVSNQQSSTISQSDSISNKSHDYITQQELLPANKTRAPNIPARLNAVSSQNPSPLPPNQLLLPSPSSAIHKRRSTINSLSPITGSNSSSLVNLVNTSNKLSQTKDKPQPQVEMGPIVSKHTNSERNKICNIDTKTNEVHSPLISHFSNPSDEQFDGSIDWLDRQESLTIPMPDRARSSSMSHYDDKHREQNQVTLEIPNFRQIRASSVGNIPVSKMIDQGKTGACEHWRITLNKSNKIPDSQQQSESDDGTANKSFRLKLDLVGSSLVPSLPQVPPSTPIDPRVSPSTEIIKSDGQKSLKFKLDNNEISKQVVKKIGTNLNERVMQSSSLSSICSSSSQASLGAHTNQLAGIVKNDDRRQSESILLSPDDGRSSSSSRKSRNDSANTNIDRKLYQQFDLVKEIDLVGARTVDTSADEEENEISLDSATASTSSASSTSSTSAGKKVSQLKASVAARLGDKFQTEPKDLLPVSKTTSSFSETPAGFDKDENLKIRRSSALPQFSLEPQAQANQQQQQEEVVGLLSNHQPATTTPQPTAPPSSFGLANSISSCSRSTIPRGSQQSQGELAQFMLPPSRAGVIVSSWSPRLSSRRSSNASAVSAFAAATAASDNPLLTQPPPSLAQGSRQSNPNEQRQSMQRISNLISDASSSLCNSRASSRLSSSAGLEGLSGNAFPPFTHSQTSLPQNQNIPRGSGSSMVGPVAAGSISGSTDLRQHNVESPVAGSPIGNAGQRLPNKRQSGTLPSAQGSRMDLKSSGVKSARAVATLRVLSVLRHWLSKHSQDFVNDTRLSALTQEFLQELIDDPRLLTAEHKSAIQLHQMVEKAAHSRSQQVDLDLLLAAPNKPSTDSIETLSALEIAEGMTYLDHKIFLAIRSEEFLGQAWMKPDKAVRAPHILLMTKRFNDVSRLVSSEIIRVSDLHRRVAVIEKWTNVAHICRVVHNFNGVLQICAAFTNSAVFRLKKTWDKISKTVNILTIIHLDIIILT